ncbi:hypothetical protein F4825DRAFT_296352 [Nemania diffusa]|nr:hypothetical protein F4825DRAFT_296352 [Nemania diffusa]
MTEQSSGGAPPDAAQTPAPTTAPTKSPTTTPATTPTRTTKGTGTGTGTGTETATGTATATATAIATTSGKARQNTEKDNTPRARQPATTVTFAKPKAQLRWQRPNQHLRPTTTPQYTGLAPNQPQQLQQQFQHISPHPPPPPPPVHPFSNPIAEAGLRDEFYGILGELDPYRVTPKEFVHLLVHAAVRDGEVAQALRRLNYDRVNSPGTWHPPAARNLTTPPYPNQPITSIPGAQARGNPPAPPSVPGQQTAASLTSPRPPKRRRGEAARDQSKDLNPKIIIYQGPPQPPPPPPPPFPHYRQSWKHSYAAEGQLQTTAPIPRSPPPPPPLLGPRNVPGPVATPIPIVSVPPAAPDNTPASPPAGDANANSNAIEPVDGEPKEQACNFTWALDRAETHLGFTGNYDNTSETRQISLGYEIALRLQKLLKKLDAAVDKHLTLANRVHILTVMREIIAATLEAGQTVGKECRECSREFDSTFLAAVCKLTPIQLKRLKVLEDGKWLEEMQSLVTEANRQAMFPLLVRAFDHINSAV